MNVENIQLIINSLALLGVVVALFSLIIQMRATKKQLELQNFMEYTRRYQEIMLNLPGSIGTAKFQYAEPKSKKYDQEMRYIRAFYDLCAEEYLLNENGFVNKKIWELWKKGIFSALNIEAFNKVWNVIKNDGHYDNEFVSFIDAYVGKRK